MLTADPGYYRDLYRSTLLDDVVPFWLRHGLDREYGGFITTLDRDGQVVDTDKSVWFQGRAGWLFATLYNTIEPRESWLDAARSCITFLRRHGSAPDGKLYFTVTREGQPLRMRRYVFSEAFAAIANAAFARAVGDSRAAADAVRHFTRYLQYSFTPGVMPAKVESATRPTVGISSYMIGIITAQEIRTNLGDLLINDQTCTEWISTWINEIERLFMKSEYAVVLETVSPDGDIIDHSDGRLLNPGHAIEASWFIMQEGRMRGDQRMINTGLTMLDWMWVRGWDEEYGGFFYFRDLFNRPVTEYWHDMKFWWPHNEAIIASLLAWRLTGQERYARLHQQVHEWSFRHFADPECGEWYGYLHRDGSVSSPLKGSIFKGPFHLPRMLWYCWRLLEEAPQV